MTRRPRVGFYYLPAKDGAQGGGVGPYTRRTLRILLESEIPCDFTLLVAESQLPEVKELAASYPQRPFEVTVLRTRNAPNVLLRSFDLARTKLNYRFLDPLASRFNYLERQMPALDVIHCPGLSLPLYTWRAKVIITPHDLQELHLPENFSPSERVTRAQTSWLAIKSAWRIAVSYEHVKADIVRFFRVDPGRVFVCPHPVKREWLPAPNHEVLAKTRAAYALPERFLFYPAQTWRHKNHLGLLRALAHLRDVRGIEPPNLVCSGMLNDFYPELLAEVARLRLNDHVRFLGLVSEEELAGLYAACTLVVIPSLYEAGSYPLMEALSGGVPVICARTTSLPEAIACDDYTFAPDEPAKMAELIARLWLDPAALSACGEHSAKRGEQLVALGTAPTEAAFARLYTFA